MKRRNLIHISTWERRKLSYLQCPELIPEIFWRQAINCEAEENICPSFTLHRTKIFYTRIFRSWLFFMSIYVILRMPLQTYLFNQKIISTTTTTTICILFGVYHSLEFSLHTKLVFLWLSSLSSDRLPGGHHSCCCCCWRVTGHWLETTTTKRSSPLHTSHTPLPLSVLPFPKLMASFICAVFLIL